MSIKKNIPYPSSNILDRTRVISWKRQNLGTEEQGHDRNQESSLTSWSWNSRKWQSTSFSSSSKWRWTPTQVLAVVVSFLHSFGNIAHSVRTERVREISSHTHTFSNLHAHMGSVLFSWPHVALPEHQLVYLASLIGLWGGATERKSFLWRNATDTAHLHVLPVGCVLSQRLLVQGSRLKCRHPVLIPKTLLSTSCVDPLHLDIFECGYARFDTRWCCKSCRRRHLKLA